MWPEIPLELMVSYHRSALETFAAEYNAILPSTIHAGAASTRSYFVSFNLRFAAVPRKDKKQKNQNTDTEINVFFFVPYIFFKTAIG